MYREKYGTECEGMINQWLDQLETHPMVESQPLTLFMILCYAYRQALSITAF